MNTLFVYGQMTIRSVKEKLNNLKREEIGGSEIVAVIVLIAIVMLLAVFFKDELYNLVKKMWDSISTNSDGVVNTPLEGAPEGGL